MTKYDSALISEGYNENVVDITFVVGENEIILHFPKNNIDKIIKALQTRDITHGNQVCFGSFFDCDNPELVATIYRRLK